MLLDFFFFSSFSFPSRGEFKISFEGLRREVGGWGMRPTRVGFCAIRFVFSRETYRGHLSRNSVASTEGKLIRAFFRSRSPLDNVFYYVSRDIALFIIVSFRGFERRWEIISLGNPIRMAR